MSACDNCGSPIVDPFEILCRKCKPSLIKPVMYTVEIPKFSNRPNVYEHTHEAAVTWVRAEWFGAYGSRLDAKRAWLASEGDIPSLNYDCSDRYINGHFNFYVKNKYARLVRA